MPGNTRMPGTARALLRWTAARLQQTLPGWTLAGWTLAAVTLAAAPAAADDLKVWRHGIIEAKSDAGIFYMASRRDLAAKLGIRIEFVQLKADTIALKALISGDLDSCEGGPGGTIAAASRGADVRVVGCHWLAPPHGIYVRPPIVALTGLRGRAVAISSPGSFPDIFARAAFKRAGIAATEVRFASLGSDTDRYKALMAGIVDGAVISNEFVPIAGRTASGEDAIRDVMPAESAVPDFVRVCIEMTGRTLRERRPLAARFLAAEIDGLRYAMSHRDDALRVTAEIAGLKAGDPRPAFVYDAAVRAGAVAPDLPVPLEKLDFVQKELVAAGTLTRPADVATLVDAGVREEALALLAAAP